ncbi:hypothetical protein PGT21_004638 [Puccinia graminis f. sp. tritici]|uniref:Uncharacterized protein n=1 Tax=Puccinia graminis f. sp. tritici TaxID=56615 RepID=A0A5B0MN83_PUCGR|nr:hypothetical protein PGT21_004638 [Puccinia graminis f. sp. tritici]
MIASCTRPGRGRFMVADEIFIATLRSQDRCYPPRGCHFFSASWSHCDGQGVKCHGSNEQVDVDELTSKAEVLSGRTDLLQQTAKAVDEGFSTLTCAIGGYPAGRFEGG